MPSFVSLSYAADTKYGLLSFDLYAADTKYGLLPFDLYAADKKYGLLPFDIELGGSDLIQLEILEWTNHLNTA